MGAACSAAATASCCLRIMSSGSSKLRNWGSVPGVSSAAKPATPPVPPNWKTGGYLERLPKDPWGGDYQYLNPGVHGEIDVFSLGADKAPGGEGNNADIGSWNL